MIAEEGHSPRGEALLPQRLSPCSRPLAAGGVDAAVVLEAPGAIVAQVEIDAVALARSHQLGEGCRSAHAASCRRAEADRRGPTQSGRRKAAPPRAGAEVVWRPLGHTAPASAGRPARRRCRQATKATDVVATGPGADLARRQQGPGPTCPGAYRSRARWNDQPVGRPGAGEARRGLGRLLAANSSAVWCCCICAVGLLPGKGGIGGHPLFGSCLGGGVSYRTRLNGYPARATARWGPTAPRATSGCSASH